MFHHLPHLLDLHQAIFGKRGHRLPNGVSVIGKSTLLPCIYDNYRPLRGVIRVRDGADWVDIAADHQRRILGLRRTVIGHVSQFLRVIPRVAAIDLVTELLRLRGVDTSEARERAATILQRLNPPEQLWGIPPATFSGGEQQRINVARLLVADYPVLLLDEPTASLDAGNRVAVTALIRDAVARPCSVFFTTQPCVAPSPGLLPEEQP